MALPIINEEFKYVKINLPSGKSIGIRGWKVKDEKELLFALETEDDAQNNKTRHIIDFLKQCVDDKSKYDTLSESDIKLICIEIRKLAKGDEIPYSYQCPECKFKLEDIVNLTKNKEVKKFDISPIKVNDKLTISVKDIEWIKTQDLYKRFENSTSKFTFHYIINSIDSVTFDGTTYTEFTEDEVIAFIDDLDPISMDKIYKEFDAKSSAVNLKRTISCLKCNTKTDVDFGEMLSFLIL